MNELLKMILSLSLSGALLILVLLLCKPLVKDKLSKRWQYYIWLIVVARLLLPFAPETNLMGTVFQHFDNAVIQTYTSIQPEQVPPVLPETDFSDQHNGSRQVGSGNGKHLELDKVTASSIFEMEKQKVAVTCLLVWLIVAIGLLIRKITVYQSFVKYIKAGQVEISDMRLWERVGKLVEQTGIKGAVGLYTNSLISSPLLIGFFRPCIMLPTTELSETDFENTILHELTHYKRWDMFYKWLVQITICFHWFNPLAYIMGQEVNQACELSCDEAVIKSLDTGGRRAYGDTLLNAMGTGGKYKDSLASVTLNESTKLLKERLDAIMKYKGKSKFVIFITLSLTLLLCVGAAGVGAAGVGAYANSESMPMSKNNSTISSESNIENANLELDIKAAAVEVLPAIENKIIADYNSEVYTVEISEIDNEKWHINITSKIGNNIGNDTVKLYLPAINYEAISLNIESASFDCEAISSGNIVTTINTSSTHFTLPAGFSGSFKADVTDGSFELSSKDMFSNSIVTVSGNVSVPDYFTKDGVLSTYSNGSNENVIEVTAVGGYSKIN